MNFALCPPDGPPRLLRYDLEGDEIVSILDAEQNLLRINRKLFNQLTPTEQERVLRTRDRVLWLGPPEGDPLTAEQPRAKAA